MLEVRANRSTPERRALARSVVRWFAEHGKPIDRNIRVIVNFSDLTDAYGEAVWNGYSSYHATSFTITVDESRTQKTDMLIETLIHEMVHVHQMATGRYRHRLNSCRSAYRTYWKNRDHTATDYSKQPWEKEAYDLEDRLVAAYKAYIAD